jgi:HPt (histidine-containing phosphotransfer) domain-containing protein
MDDYVSKPVRQEDLVRVLEKFTKGGEPDAQAVAVKHAGIDQQRIDSLRSISEDVFQEVISAFLEVTPAKLHELEQAALGGDLRKVEALAHSIRGSAATIGGMGLAQVLAGMEQDSQSGKREKVLRHLPLMKSAYNSLAEEFGRVVSVGQSKG